MKQKMPNASSPLPFSDSVVNAADGAAELPSGGCPMPALSAVEGSRAFCETWGIRVVDRGLENDVVENRIWQRRFYDPSASLGISAAPSHAR